MHRPNDWSSYSRYIYRAQWSIQPGFLAVTLLSSQENSTGNDESPTSTDESPAGTDENDSCCGSEERANSEN
jgi:hypothetical protein